MTIIAGCRKNICITREQESTREKSSEAINQEGKITWQSLNEWHMATQWLLPVVKSLAPAWACYAQPIQTESDQL